MIDPTAEKLRDRAVRVSDRSLLITDFRGTAQEPDLSEPPNCGGLGRIRHYRRGTNPGWPSNPLPQDPAQVSLSMPPSDEIRAQLFQNAACNWRCWYCYVPFTLLSAREEHASWVTARELIQRYVRELDPPAVLVLSGGQPDLVPEWIPWTMEALEEFGLANRTFLWSDDNLSNDFFWRFLSDREIQKVADYGNYGRVGCFKGFDEASFAFNTAAAPERFFDQFGLFERLASIGLDLYAYVTLTSPSVEGVDDAMARFVDRLQEIHELLPLRTVPLEIRSFTPTKARMNDERESAIENQWRVVEAWNRQLDDRFPATAREVKLTEVAIGAPRE